MKKICTYFGFATIIIYLWFGILPEMTGFSLPTGGWDWLNFTGIIIGLVISAWGIIEAIKNNSDISKKQQIMASKPCLDVDPFSEFSFDSPNNVFRVMEFSNRIINKGFILLRSNDKEIPALFSCDCNIKIRNIGLSTAFKITVTLFKLEKVDGLSSLDEIDKIGIDNFYDNVHVSNFIYYEGENLKKGNWIISPAYNLNNNRDEFNLVFDLTKVITENHCILKFNFEDVYGTKYYQRLYLYFDGYRSVSFLPISTVKE
jgi:hypothetical protein